MKIMLDLGPTMISDREKKFGIDFFQLRTPLSRNRLTGRPYGLDNGCFTKFRRATWMRMLDEAREVQPIFAALPDVVGDARRTLELFSQFEEITEGIPRALVLQDGIGNFSIPWDRIAAVFVGGSDSFKISAECMNACKAAKILDKWIHVGRVNTVERLGQWVQIADSIDGSGISKYDHMLAAMVDYLKAEERQADLFDDGRRCG